MSLEPQKLSPQIAQLVFSMFIYVADVEKNITVQEVRRFQTLLKETSWSDNSDLLEAFYDLRERYPAFWSAYEDGHVPVNSEALSAALTHIGFILGEERDKKLRRDLHKFLERLEGSAYGLKLLQGEQKAKALARKDLVKIVGDDITTSAAHRKQAIVASIPAPAIGAQTAEAQVAPPTGTSIWQSGKIQVRCVSIVEETHDTKTYYFAAEPQIQFIYKPGQLVIVEIPLATQLLKRSYTISSSPSRPQLLSITVKKVPMGWMSNWLYDNMTVGMGCTVSGPAGNFTCADYANSHLLFLAAGSGITPCMSMLRWLADTPGATDIVFINCVRTPRDIIFHQELIYLSMRLGPRLRLAILPSALCPGQPWQGAVGRLDEAFLRSYVQDFLKREVFACGPSGFLGVAKSILSNMGFPLEHYHHENFGGPAVNPAFAQKTEATDQYAAPAQHPSFSVPTVVSPCVRQALSDGKTPMQAIGRAADGTPVPESVASIPDIAKLTPAERPLQSARITISRSGERFDAAPGQTILEAAEASGVGLPHACRSGLCGACKMHADTGQADMPNGYMLSADEIAEGHVLTCVGRTKGDLTLSG